MTTLLEIIRQPWSWYVAGPLIGLIVPTLLLIGNKSFGISSSMRHICAACLPANIPFFQYDWKKEIWNLFFVAGILIGGFISMQWLSNPESIIIDPRLSAELSTYGITKIEGLVPEQLFNWSDVWTVRGFIMTVIGGLLVGFGTRYAGGCTSGHAIMGLSTLQLPSLIATICFMVGGFISANYILPFILSL
ncbi:MAG: YeeE/YedE family protein [Sphingobacteriales bacterium]|nr:YeeE/YedE family protein [Sphingobacteriales bacterium]